MKNIIIDITKLHPDSLKRGVGIYTRNLYKTLNAKNAKKDTRKTRNDRYFLRKTRNEEYQADLIHYPYFDPFFLTLPRRRRIPIIVTVHDLTPLKFPKHYPCGLRGKMKWQIQKYLLKKVDIIITDSKNSKKDIINIINYPENKIFPIYLAASNKYKKLEIGNYKLEICKKYSLPEYFLLYVGDLNWNKNVAGLVRAFYEFKTSAKGLSSGQQNLKLLLIGNSFKLDKLEELDELKKLINKLGLKEQIKLLGFVPIEDLTKIYNLAHLYIQPSFYEGFGLPVLEAMKCGCPVLSSNQASLPEVGGKAVEYFNPQVKGDLERKIRNLISNKKRLKELGKSGLKQAAKFSWKKTAEETAKVYKKVFKNEIRV